MHHHQWLALVAAWAAACGPEAGVLEPAVWPTELTPPPTGTFPQYRGDASHGGLAPEGASLGDTLELSWKSEAFAIGDYSASKGSPVVDAERVYAGFDDGLLRALDRETGALLWQFRTYQADVEDQREDSDNRGIHGTPAVEDGVVYIGDYSGWLYAVEATDGSLLWETDLGGSIGASPVLFGGHVFMAVEFGAPDGKMFVVDAASGIVRFETPYLGEQPHSSVSVDPSRGWMFVGANNGLLSAYDFVAEDTSPVWEYQMDEGEDGDIKSTVAVVGDTLYATSWDRQLHAVDIDSGQRLWTFATDGLVMSSPSPHDGVVTFGSHDGTIYTVSADGDLGPDASRVLWTVDTPARVMSSATVVPGAGALVIGSNSWDAYLLDTDDGSVLWTTALDGVLNSVPAVAGSSVFLTDGSGTVWRFD